MRYVIVSLSDMLHLLVDTSTWLDLAKRRDGQRWIVAMRLLVHQGDLQLLVPNVVIDEFERNRDRIDWTPAIARARPRPRATWSDPSSTDRRTSPSCTGGCRRCAMVTC